MLLPNDFACQFKRTLQAVFGENLVFAFVFGSFAKGYADVNHDLDTFVCVRKHDTTQCQDYLKWLHQFSASLGLVYDQAYPAEILTELQLEQVVERLPSIRLLLDGNSTDVFDAIVWTEVLAGQKRYIVGNLQTLYRFAAKCQSYPLIWKQQVLNEIAALDPLRAIELAEREPLYLFRKVVQFETSARPY